MHRYKLNKLTCILIKFHPVHILKVYDVKPVRAKKTLPNINLCETLCIYVPMWFMYSGHSYLTAQILSNKKNPASAGFLKQHIKIYFGSSATLILCAKSCKWYLLSLSEVPGMAATISALKLLRCARTIEETSVFFTLVLNNAASCGGRF